MRFNKRNEVTRNTRLKWCPTADCEGILDIGKKLGRIETNLTVQCPECQKEYCFRCLCPDHPDSTCESVIDKEYKEWANDKTDVGYCKNCMMRIEKDGGCPNMICNLCKHEWCWFCNEDAPIHTSECPFYPEYLKII